MRSSARIVCAVFFTALVVACGPVAGTQRGSALEPSQLDAIDAAMERLAGDQWNSWTMELVNGALAFRVEVAATPPGEACMQIAGAVRSGSGVSMDWSAELLHRGMVVERCSA